MKKGFYQLALACLTILAITGCQPKTPLDPHVYAIYLNYMLLENEVNSQYMEKDQAMTEYLTSAGLFGQDPYVLMTGETSISIGRQVKSKLDSLNQTIEGDPLNLRAAVLAYGVEQKFLGVNEENIGKVKFEMLAYKMYGAPDNSEFLNIAGLQNAERAGQWVRDIRKGKRNSATTNEVCFGTSNFDRSFFYLEFSDNAIAGNLFDWDDKATYITDVVVVSDSDYIEMNTLPDITIEGRTYRPMLNTSAINVLNRGFFYLYATTDAVEGYEGYYLNPGCRTEDLDKQCRSAEDYSAGEVEKAVAEPYIWEGHRFVERIVKEYDLNGNLMNYGGVTHGVANFRGLPQGEHSTLAYILTYASKEMVEK